MGTVLGDLLPLAMGVAISPIPLVAAILVILSNTSTAPGLGFAAGWVAAIAVVTAVVVLLSGAFGGDREPSPAVAWVKIVLGVLLLGLAGRQWRARSDTATPRWMRAIDGLAPARAVGLGATLAALNPKNLLLCVSAGVGIGSGGLGGGAEVVAVVVYTMIAAASVLLVVVGYVLAADRLRATLDTAREWLQANNHAVLAIVLLVMGTVVLGKGIGGL
ncbi:GAP family protein [Nocardia wallacei]|uniref:GAP family protein n=1 Tax=Nocardia wallacei TaxID=480035 RepID=UPI0024580127|nr:GAP family protein [Nocardia wallacei]